MAQEIRRIPLYWEHPKDKADRYIPLRDGNRYRQDLAAYEDGEKLWLNGYRHDSLDETTYVPVEPKYASLSWEDWYGSRPVRDEYGPEVLAGTLSGYQKYEIVSFGTPVSPIFRSVADLESWCTATRLTRAVLSAHHLPVPIYGLDSRIDLSGLWGNDDFLD